jgi:alpha-mannosidase/mannosylglycerate hydrolase
MSENSKLYLYLHTHWDREWYFPFEIYRTQLVSVTREIVKRLESGELPNFLLDGQAAILEDVLEIDPTLQHRLKKLVEAGKLSTGPWYVLADQMLVSGESLIRNLKMGIEISTQFGLPCLVGYCPDTFGHSHDLPRILNGFGIKTAYVWRGVPQLKDGPVFHWQSPDGSKVIAYHLSRGYYQTIFHDALSTDERATYLANWTSASPHEAGNPVAYSKLFNGSLFPVGGDHMAPPSHFVENLDLLNMRLNEQRADGDQPSTGRISLAPIALSDFSRMLSTATASATTIIPTIDDELRDNCSTLLYGRSYLLPGVLSTRLYLKRENRLAEHRLTKIVEPLNTLLHLSHGLPYPHYELNYAWKLLLKNHPHDSICGCSVDTVHQEMMVRSQRLNQMLDALDRLAREKVSRASNFTSLAESKEQASLSVSNLFALDPSFPANSLVVYNLAAESLKGPVRFSWAGDLNLRTKEDYEAAVAAILSETASDVQVTALQVKSDEEVFTHAGGTPIFKHVQFFEGWLWLDRIPAVGLKEVPWRGPHMRGGQDKPIKPSSETDLVFIGPKRLANEFFEIDLQNDGTLKIMAVEGSNRKDFLLGHLIRDLADAGDSYNFDPIESDKPLYARLTGCRIGQKGPLVGSLLLSYELDIPAGLEETGTPTTADPSAPVRPRSFKRTNEKITHRFITEISLRRGVPIVFFDTTWENYSRDHRLEVLFQTGSTVERTFSENHFSVIERSALHPKSPLPVPIGFEAAPDRFPCQRFFLANGQVFLNSGLPEYGAEDSAVIITLLRSVSRLGRPRLRTRGSGAGPNIDTPEANCWGLNRASYGWSPLPGKVSGKVTHNNLSESSLIHAYRTAELFEGTFWATLAARPSDRFDSSLLGIDNPAIRLMSLYLSENRTSLCLRLLNVTRQPQEAVLSINLPCKSAKKCRINEEIEEDLERLDGDPADATKSKKYKLKLRSNELFTVKIDTAGFTPGYH